MAASTALHMICAHICLLACLLIGWLYSVVKKLLRVFLFEASLVRSQCLDLLLFSAVVLLGIPHRLDK